jgi:quercetin dioxygenase-like cupin family protein
VDPAHMRPVFVPPGTGTFLGSINVQHRLTGEQTDGTCYLFESTFEPGMGNRLHVHRDEDEIGYVLDGALEVRLEAETRVLEEGGVARLPKGIPHAIRNPLPTSSRYLFIAVPAGLDRWFDAIARAREEGTLDVALTQELADRFGVRWLE